MAKRNTNQPEVVIDESKHTAAPSALQRIKQVLMAILIGLVFAQVMLFAFRQGSIVFYFWLYTELFVLYLVVCAVLGWFYGDKIVQTLGKKSSDWWNLWSGKF